MVKPSAAHWRAAEQLHRCENAGGARGDDHVAAAGRVHDKLSARLATLVGLAATRALFARSVRLTAPDFACLGKIQIAAHPDQTCAEQIVLCLRGESAESSASASIALCATVLALLATLIGDRLTMQVLGSAWPGFDATNQEIE